MTTTTPPAREGEAVDQPTCVNCDRNVLIVIRTTGMAKSVAYCGNCLPPHLRGRLHA